MELNLTQINESKKPDSSGCLNLVVFAAVTAWVLVFVVTRTAALPLVYIYPGPNTPWTAALLAAGSWFLLAVPLVPLAIWWREPKYKAIFRTWALASGLILTFLPIYFVDPSAAQLQAVLHTLAGLAYVGFLLILRRRSARQGVPPSGRPTVRSGSILAILVSLVLGAVLAYPWLAWGALGSLLDVLFEALLAITIGFLAGILLNDFLFHTWSRTGETVPVDGAEFILAAIGAGITLLIISSATAFGFGGMQGELMKVLPPLGGALVGLHWVATSRNFADQGVLKELQSKQAGRRRALVTLVALAAAAPLTLVDPDELSLLVSSGPGELLYWTSRAANLGAAAGLSFSLLAFLIFLFGRTRYAKPQAEITLHLRRSILFAALAVGACAGGAAIYARFGQPGLYGERIFVILKDQADVSSASGIQDYNARRQYVYQTLTNHAQSSQAGLRGELDRLGLAYTPYYLVNGIEVQGDTAIRLWLSNRPDVDRILDSPRMRPLPEMPKFETGTSPQPSEPTWNLTLIHAPQVWHELGVTGKGITIGQSDSGAQADHPELFDSYRGRDGDNNYNWFDPWFGTQTPEDIGGHGTHTLGIMVGNTTGVAPDATWYGCVNLARNLGNPALYLDCMQFMLAPFPIGGNPFTDGDPSRGAQISSNSWGCPEMEGCDPNALLPAVTALRAAGIFVVAAAGNTGPDCSSVEDPPALYQPVYSIGAINSAGGLADFSSRGPVDADGSGRVKPDLVAPGVQVLSSLPGSSYGENTGTSMAAPHVAGVVALMWSANPALIGNIDRTEQILDETTQLYQGALPDCPRAAENPSTAVGYGIVDAFAAVKLALQEGK